MSNPDSPYSPCCKYGEANDCLNGYVCAPPINRNDPCFANGLGDCVKIQSPAVVAEFYGPTVGANPQPPFKN